MDTLDLKQLQKQLDHVERRSLYRRWLGLILLIFVAIFMLPSMVVSNRFANTYSQVKDFIPSLCVLVIILSILELQFLPSRYEYSIAKRINQQAVSKQPITYWMMMRQKLTRRNWLIWIGLVAIVGLFISSCLLIIAIIGFLSGLGVEQIRLSVFTQRTQALHRAIMLGEFDQARIKMDRLLGQYPEEWNIQVANARLLTWEGDLVQALTLQLELMQPAQPWQILELWDNHAETLLWAEMYVESLSYIESIIHVLPHSTRGYTLLARFYLLQNMASERALELLRFSRRMRSNIKDLEYWETQLLDLYVKAQLGNTHHLTIELAEFTETITQKIETLVVYIVPLYYLIGRIYAMLDEHPNAQMYFQKVYDLNPQGIIGQATQKYLGGQDATR